MIIYYKERNNLVVDLFRQVSNLEVFDLDDVILLKCNPVEVVLVYEARDEPFTIRSIKLHVL